MIMSNQPYVKPYEHEGFMALADMFILQACNTNIATNIKLLITASEMGNKYGYLIIAKYYKKIRMFKEMENYLKKNIETFECDESMLELGLYYDDACQNEKSMIEYYELASNLGNIDATYNLYTYYRGIKDDVNMRKYLDRGVELGDADALFEYALDYSEKHDFEKMIQYYERAVESEGHNSLVNDGIHNFNILQLIQQIEKLPKLSEVMCKKLNTLKTQCPDYLIYKNKINLFTRLNLIEECSICYETKLQIDFKCAHTFCVDCYPNLYMKPCPMCRT